jgi:hypothetical protein
MQRLLDRLIGLLLLVAFAPSLAILSLWVRFACGRPAFEWRLRIDCGNIFRTRRLKVDGCRLGKWLRQHSLEELPVVLDLAAGRARLALVRTSASELPLHTRVAIKAPRPKRNSQPAAASANHARTVVE